MPKLFDSLVAPLCLAFLVAAESPARAQTTCPSWSPGFHIAGADGSVNVFTVIDEGQGPRLVAGGEFRAAGDVVASRIARFDGTAWSALGGGVDGTVHALLARAEPGGEVLYVGGAFTSASGIAASRIARWDGASWSALGSGLPGVVRALCLHDSGSGAGQELYAAGDFPGAVARWNGAQWSILGPGLSGGSGAHATSLAVYDDGSGAAPSLFVGGQFSSAGGTFVSNIARWDGNIWISPHSGINGTVRALAVFDDGSGSRLFAGGQLTNAGGATVTNVARWNGTTWSAAGSPPFIASLSTHDDGTGVRLYAVTNYSTLHSLRAWNGTSWDVSGPTLSRVQVVHAYDAGGGARVYAGGDFTASSAAPTSHIACKDASGWSPPMPGGQGLRGEIYDMTAHDDGSGSTLHLCGNFETGLFGPLTPRILRWNGSGWTELPNPSRTYALASFDDGGGSALFRAGAASAGSFHSRVVSRWDGSAWTVIGDIVAASPQFINSLTTLDDGNGPRLYATGSFTSIAPPSGAPVSAPRVARWDGTTWSGFGAGPLGLGILTVAFYDDGLGAGPALYAGGYPDASFGGIARWNGTSWVDVGGGVDGRIHDLIVHDDGTGPQLYACGTFAHAGGVPARGIARWNGSAWSSVGGGTSPALDVTSVRALATFDAGAGAGTQLFVHGESMLPSSETQVRLARWDGSAWSVAGLEIVGPRLPVTAPAGPLQPVQGPMGAELWCSGAFQLVGGQVSYGIARFDACDSAGAAFCLGDGSAAACPCGNASAPGTIAGCVHSLGGAGTLAASGLASVGADSLVLRGSGMTNGAGLYFQGSARSNGGAGVPFGDGLRCATGTVVRLGIVLNSGGGSRFPGATGAGIAQVGRVHAGDLRHYQIWYRDAASWCTSANWNLTNGLSIGWGL